MIKIKSGNKIYEYDKYMDTVLIDTKIRKDINKFFKSRKINKSKLIEEFYKTILIRFHDGTLNLSSGYITLNILKEPIIKLI